MTSATVASVARTRSAAATWRFTPCAPPPIATGSPAAPTVASAITGQAWLDAERRDRAAFVAGRRERLVLVGEREPADAEVRAELRPIDPPPAGHQHEDVVVGAAAHDDRAQQLSELDPLQFRRSPRRCGRAGCASTSNGMPAARAATVPGVSFVSLTPRTADRDLGVDVDPGAQGVEHHAVAFGAAEQPLRLARRVRRRRSSRSCGTRIVRIPTGNSRPIASVPRGSQSASTSIVELGDLDRPCSRRPSGA